MKNYLKLVNFELNRFAKIFAVLLGITFVAQMIGVIVASNTYMNRVNALIYEEFMPKAEFIERYGNISFHHVISSGWFLGPIALCIAGVAFYIFLIWYRDWFGKNTFIYRLLMLPTTRINIFYAKITSILVITFGFVAFQLIFIPIESMVLKWMVPEEFRLDLGMKEIVHGSSQLNLLIPSSMIEFILYYGVGCMGVSILFTAILFERSFRWKGIFIGVIYSVVAVFVFFIPLFLHETILEYFFYPLELFLLEILMGLLVLAGSVWMSGFLLKKKITV